MDLSSALNMKPERKNDTVLMFTCTKMSLVTLKSVVIVVCKDDQLCYVSILGIYPTGNGLWLQMVAAPPYNAQHNSTCNS